MNDAYNIPAQTQIGHVHLKAADLKRSLGFYCDLLGFSITTMYSEDAAFISAGGYHHHIGLNTWYNKGGILRHCEVLDCFTPLFYTPPGKTRPPFTNVL